MEIKSVYGLWPEKKGFELDIKGTENFYVFVHFLSGVKQKNGDEIKKGACILYKPFSHRYFFAKDSDLIHDWMHFTGSADITAAKYNIEMNKIYYPENDSEITEIIKEIEVERLTCRPYCSEICDLKIEELFAKIARGINMENNPRVDKETYERFFGIRSIMQTEFNKIQSIEQLAARVNLSSSRFYVLYRKIFGISPKQDLLNIRMEHAKQLLLQKNCSVCEIAEQLGYGNQYHFIRQFKKITGTTPAKYARCGASYIKLSE